MTDPIAVVRYLKDCSSQDLSYWLLIHPNEWQIPKDQQHQILYAELDAEQKKLVDSQDFYDQLEAAVYGWGVDKLAENYSWAIRFFIARHGYNLENFVHDEHTNIRTVVALQGHGSGVLVRDPSVLVRIGVARSGCALDVLVDDIDPSVREEVLLQNYGLDKLWHDDDLRPYVDDFLRERHLTIYQWLEYYPERCALLENRPESGVGIPYAKLNDNQRTIADAKGARNRIVAVELGYGLDKLVDDEDGLVRMAVARRGYGLGQLIDDPDPFVRVEVVRHNYRLDKLVDDPCSTVREAVLAQGYGLDKLIDDRNRRIRSRALDFLLDKWIEQNPDKVALPEYGAAK